MPSGRTAGMGPTSSSSSSAAPLGRFSIQIYLIFFTFRRAGAGSGLEVAAVSPLAPTSLSAPLLAASDDATAASLTSAQAPSDATATVPSRCETCTGFSPSAGATTEGEDPTLSLISLPATGLSGSTSPSQCLRLVPLLLWALDDSALDFERRERFRRESFLLLLVLVSLLLLLVLLELEPELELELLLLLLLSLSESDVELQLLMLERALRRRFFASPSLAFPCRATGSTLAAAGLASCLFSRVGEAERDGSQMLYIGKASRCAARRLRASAMRASRPGSSRRSATIGRGSFLSSPP
mmetsp:Transcript_2223/g.7035  ORF Transcript_2223/g.7035 Transcript_2223/m.7035 type:complete len:298 (-) Transcript_2223:785-1678(-)